MGVDRAYHAFLHHLNELGGAPVFRVLKVLPVEDYGFMEFVDHRPCESDQELERFYRHAGHLLAVLYMLGCNDCHNENVIANGDQLVLIDVETLLQGDRDDPIERRDAGPDDLRQKLGQSVLRVGLLPQWRFMAVGGRMRAIDSSALGVARLNQTTTRDGWVAMNSDRMHWGRVDEPAATPTSSPVTGTRPGLFEQFASSLCEGFAVQMQHFLRHKDDLLAPGALLDRFAGLPRRVVVRPTQVYATIQLQALEPDALHTAVARGVKLDQLSRQYLIPNEKPFDWPIFESELRQMETLDIPYFEQAIDSDVLRLPGGMEPIPGFVRASGLAASRRRVERLEQADIDFQLQLIRGAIEASQLQSTRPSDDGQDATSPGIVGTTGGAARPLSQERRLTEARRLATQLQQRILRGSRGRPAWLGLDLAEDQERFRFGIVGPSLYSGRSGIALFFSVLAQHLDAHPGHAAEAARLREDARQSMSTVLETLESDDAFAAFRWVRDQPLGLAGTGGLILSLLTLERLGLRPPSGSYSAVAHALADRITVERIHADNRLDIIAGCAGLVGPLLSLARVREAAGESPRDLLALAGACGDHLVTQQSENDAWPSMDAKKSLTGFSHGAGGIAAALARLHRATQATRYLTSARRGLAYERSQFSPPRGNWPDFRTTEHSTQFMNSWCHGAPGIALARLCLRHTCLWDAEVEQELEVALTTTVRDDVAVDQVCCGAFGKITILKIAAANGLGTHWGAAAEAILTRRIGRAERHGGAYRLFSPAEGHIFLPGLFTGTSGIGLVSLTMEDVDVLAGCLSCGLLENRNGRDR